MTNEHKAFLRDMAKICNRMNFDDAVEEAEKWKQIFQGHEEDWQEFFSRLHRDVQNAVENQLLIF